MALVIGPKQSVDPSKPSKAGRDQLMQMIDWLRVQGKTSIKTSAGLGEKLTVYSKKFGESGTFKDNAGNNAFSLKPSTIYTEEWHIWIMASTSAKSGTNPWNSYGSNGGTTGGAGGTEGHQVTVDNKLATYVPDGKPLIIQAIINNIDAQTGCKFVGVYYTKLDENGNPVSEFIQLAGNEIEFSESLTDEEKRANG